MKNIDLKPIGNFIKNHFTEFLNIAYIHSKVCLYCGTTCNILFEIQGVFKIAT